MFKFIASEVEYKEFKKAAEVRGIKTIEEKTYDRFPAIFHIGYRDEGSSYEQLGPDLIDSYIRAMDGMWK